MPVALPLRKVLYSAYQCKSSKSICRKIRYSPQIGLLPRGFTGAFGKLKNVRLIICLAEPGEPRSGESYNAKLSKSELVNDIAERVANEYRNNRDNKGWGFHSNVRRVLDFCWPNLGIGEQLKRTWITEGTLCSANKSTGRIPSGVERECAMRHLRSQLDLFPNAFIIALGKKAERRLAYCGKLAHISARAAGNPVGDQKHALNTWRKAGKKFIKYMSKEKNRPHV